MLSTNAVNKLPIPVALVEPGHAVWNHVTLELSIPYFLIRFEQCELDHWLAQSKIFWKLDDVVHFCSLVNEHADHRLRQVAMITPARMNQSDGWRMTDLSAIKRVFIPGTDDSVTVFITKDGLEICDSASAEDLTSSLQHETLVSLCH